MSIYPTVETRPLTWDEAFVENPKHNIYFYLSNGLFYIARIYFYICILL